jgi:hypothetical protein
MSFHNVLQRMFGRRQAMILMVIMMVILSAYNEPGFCMLYADIRGEKRLDTAALCVLVVPLLHTAAVTRVIVWVHAAYSGCNSGNSLGPCCIERL